MKKAVFIGLFVVVLAVSLVYADSHRYSDAKDDFEKQKAWIKNNLNIDISGNAFKYEEASNSLTISSESAANFKQDFNGKIIINGGTIKLVDGSVFTGDGSFSKEEKGFTIKNGILNGIDISNALGVTFNSKQIEGTTSQNCNPDCRIAGEKIGPNTKFVYNIETGLAAKGNSKSTTFPDGKIFFDGFDYYLGDVKLNPLESEIYVSPGSKMTVDGIPIKAEKRPVRLVFKEYDAGRILIPVKTFVPSKSDVSVADIFKEVGYTGYDNFQERKKLYESQYPNEIYSGTAAQNIKLLEALKSGDIKLEYNEKYSKVRIITRFTDSTPVPNPRRPTAEELHQKVNNPGYIPPQHITKYTGEIDAKAVLKNINDNMLIHIVEQSNKNNIPPILPILIGAVESRFKEDTGCVSGSCGIMQIKPSTAKGLGFNPKDPLEPYKAVEIGTKYLGQFNQRYSNIPLPERIFHIAAAYKNGARGYETQGINKKTEEYLLKVDQFQKRLEPAINARLSKLKK